MAAVPRVLLTAARGFLGRALYLALAERGVPVRCSSRNPEAAERAFFGREWVRLDPADPGSIEAALEGCEAAIYLLHDPTADPDAQEALARTFREAAAAAGLSRLVFPTLVPARAADPLDRGRAAVMRVLLAGPVPTVVLRPSLVVGYGNWRWDLIRDLAARLLFVPIPRWAKARLQPVAEEDFAALVAAAATCEVPPGLYDAPGPETVTLADLVRRTAARAGHRTVPLGLPFASRALASRLVGLLTRDGAHARDLLRELGADRLASSDAVWHLAGVERRTLDAAIDAALASDPVPSAESLVEQLVDRAARLRA